jgi:hypothetical protein
VIESEFFPSELGYIFCGKTILDCINMFSLFKIFLHFFYMTSIIECIIFFLSFFHFVFLFFLILHWLFICGIFPISNVTEIDEIKTFENLKIWTKWFSIFRDNKGGTKKRITRDYYSWIQRFWYLQTFKFSVLNNHSPLSYSKNIP